MQNPLQCRFNLSLLNWSFTSFHIFIATPVILLDYYFVCLRAFSISLYILHFFSHFVIYLSIFLRGFCYALLFYFYVFEFILSILHSYFSQWFNIYKNVFSFWKSKWEIGKIGCLRVAGVTSLDCRGLLFLFFFPIFNNH